MESLPYEFGRIDYELNMCNFITSWICGPLDKGGLKSILDANGFGFHEYPDSPIKYKLKVPLYFRPGKGQCDCGSDLGDRDRKAKREAPLEEKVALLREKGWSETKINRWVEERMRVERKGIREKNARKGSQSETVEEWWNLLNALLDTHGIKSVGILFHDYHGNQTLEDFDLRPMVKLNFAAMTAEKLCKIQTDTPYEISRKSG